MYYCFLHTYDLRFMHAEKTLYYRCSIKRSRVGRNRGHREVSSGAYTIIYRLVSSSKTLGYLTGGSSFVYILYMDQNKGLPPNLLLLRPTNSCHLHTLTITSGARGQRKLGQFITSDRLNRTSHVSTSSYAVIKEFLTFTLFWIFEFCLLF